MRKYKSTQAGITDTDKVNCRFNSKQDYSQGHTAAGKCS